MSRYIDLASLPMYEEIFLKGKKIKDTTWVRYRDIESLLRHAPVADVVERKKGKWMTKSTFMPDHYGGYYIDQYVCTNCESEFFKPSKFCPNCGADMRGEGGEEK